MIKTKKMKKYVFRLQAKSLFLTYPSKLNDQVKKTKMMIETKLKDVEWYIIAKENADEDHPYEHFHILIKSAKKFDIIDQSKLDIENVHGNYQTTRNILNAFDYVTKENQWKMYSEKLDDIQIEKVIYSFNEKLFNVKRINKQQEFNKLLLKSAIETKDLNLIKDKIYKIKESKCINRRDLEFAIACIKNKKLIDELEKMLSNNKLEDNTIWVHRSMLTIFYLWLKNINMYGQPYSLFIQGEPGIGKTSLLKHLFGYEALFVQHKDKLKEYDKQRHKYIVFDDISFKGFGRSNIIQLIDSEQDYQADVKNSMVNISKDSVKVFTSNEDQQSLIKSFKYDKAIARRQYKASCRSFICNDRKVLGSSFSDVLGDGIEVYIKDKYSFFYDVTVTLEKPFVLYRSEEVQRYLDKGDSYIPLNIGMMNSFRKDISSLELLLYGSKDDKNRKKFDISIKILEEQQRKNSYYIDKKYFEDILKKYISEVICICKNIKEINNQYKGNECLLCYFKKYVFKY